MATDSLEIGAAIQKIDQLGTDISKTWFGYLAAVGGALVSFGNVYFEPHAERLIGQPTRASVRPALLSPQEYATLFYRVPDERGMIQEQFNRVGLPNIEQAWLLKLAEFLPTPSDLITLSVKEAFNDAFAAQFNLDSEFPREFTEFGKLQGMSEEWTKRYWRAHWELPSPQQAFEMVQRLSPQVLRTRGSAYQSAGLDPANLAFTFGELRALLKAQDFAPFWRDRLAAIAYAPLTRVDIRRLYDAGVIDDEEFIVRNQELGYPRQDAEKILAWAKAENSGQERELTKAEIIASFKAGLISVGETNTLLIDLGYSRDNAERITELAIAQEVAKERAKNKEKTITDKEKHKEITKTEVLKAVKVGQISKADALTFLVDLGYDAADANFVIAVNLAEQKTEERQINQGMIEKQLETGVITKEEAIALLQGLGFSPSAAANIAQAIQVKKALRVTMLPFGYARTLFKEGYYSEKRFRDYLLSSGYVQDDVEATVQREIAKQGVAEEIA